ncbi:hypothetical protein [Longispora urticae]
MTLRRASLALSTLLLLGAVAGCDLVPGRNPTVAPSPSAVKLTDPEMFAMARKALLPEDALAEISFPGKSEPEAPQAVQSMLLGCAPGLTTDPMITGRAVRIWPNTQRQWALSGAYGFQDATAAQVIGEIRRTIPEKCHSWRRTSLNPDRTMDHASDLELPELPGTTASYGYCLTVTFTAWGNQTTECAVFVGRKSAGMDLVASFHYSNDNATFARAGVIRLAPKVAEQLLKV